METTITLIPHSFATTQKTQRDEKEKLEKIKHDEIMRLKKIEHEEKLKLVKQIEAETRIKKTKKLGCRDTQSFD